MNEPLHRLFLLHALTPLHIGGDEGVGGIDLPTMREAHTGYPLVPGSSLKGVLREAGELAHGVAADAVRGAFGPPQAEAGDFRGGLVLTDAHLLALPVRSLYGTFAWLTCAPVLARLDRDLALSGAAGRLPSLAKVGKTAALVAAAEDGQPASALVGSSGGRHRVFLEELIMEVEASPEVTTVAEGIAGWLWPGEEGACSRELFTRRLLVVHEDVFAFYTRLGMEIRSRVKIERETGTAAGSGPWAEEHMPAETLLAGLAMGRATRVKPPRKPEERGGPEEGEAAAGESWPAGKSLEVLEGLAAGAPVLRFGGHSTIGLGRARFHLAPNGAPPRKEKP